MEIRIYVEGGGDNKDTKAEIRKGFGIFFQELRDQARSLRMGWNIIACGSRQRTFDNFTRAQRTHAEAFNILLVDSEGPVSSSPWQHLNSRDNWETNSALDEQYHLMVQVMETWFIADIESLRRFYGDDFNINYIPRTSDVEQIDKDILVTALNTATHHTQKGEYQKIRHGAKLLRLIDPSIVRQAAPHCDRLFNILVTKMAISN